MKNSADSHSPSCDTLLQDALEAGRVALLALDAEGRILHAGDRAATMLRIAPEQLPGLNFLDRLLPSEKEAFSPGAVGAGEFVAALREGAERGAAAGTWLVQRFDGKLAQVRLNFRLPPCRADEREHLLVYCRDVTAQRTLQRVLIERHNRFSAFLDVAVEGILLVSAEGIIREANRAAASIFGYERGELPGRGVEMLIPEPHRSLHAGYIREYLRTGVGSIIGKEAREVEGLRKDGGLVPLELSVVEVQDENEILFLGILRDISRRKAEESMLRSAYSRLAAKQGVINADLRAAEAIQTSLLPTSLEGVTGVEVDWRFQPSTRVGGDIFNIVPLHDGNFALYMLDVSGHGVSSALVAVSVWQALAPGSRHLMRRSGEPRKPERVVQRLEDLFPVERFGKFFSLFYMVYNPASGTLHYCNAGHPAPMLLRGGGRVEYLEEGGTIVGLGGLLPPTGGETKVAEGDVLLLYTDGYSEHEDASGRLFGQTGMRKALQQAGSFCVDDILDAVTTAFNDFAPGKRPQDDLTMVCMRFLGPTGQQTREGR